MAGGATDLRDEAADAGNASFTLSLKAWMRPRSPCTHACAGSM